MLTTAWIDGARVSLRGLAPLGTGGEADVLDLGDGRALKLYKDVDHPDVAGVPGLEQAAAARLAQADAKLRALPTGLPDRAVRPQALAYRRRGGDVVGFAMPRVAGEPLHRLAEPHWRRAATVTQADVVEVLRDLRASVEAVHHAGAVIGDFNDANVLVDGARAWLIDVDSWQWGGWRCPMFSERFVDPRLCAPGATSPMPVLPHDADSDWFAFAVMVFRSLLLTGPYGGVFQPADPARRVPQAARPLHRLSVFDREVVYPRAALPWDRLPDDVVDYFQAVFVRDRRGPFPAALLDGLRFRRCACGAEHARASCPACRTVVPAPARAAGRLTVTRIAAAQLVLGSREVGGEPGAGVWMAGGTLWRAGAVGAEAIGQVLAGATRAWVGATLGVGLWRAGGYACAFVFRPDRRGLRDGVALPRIRGALLDVHAVVGGDRAWLWWREALAGRETVRLAAISAAGEVLGLAEAPGTDPGWLAGVPGACAAGPLLLVPSDAGVVRVEVTPAGVAVTRTFSETADVVSAGDSLFPAPGGLDVRTRDGALRLALS